VLLPGGIDIFPQLVRGFPELLFNGFGGGIGFICLAALGHQSGSLFYIGSIRDRQGRKGILSIELNYRRLCEILLLEKKENKVIVIGYQNCIFPLLTSGISYIPISPIKNVQINSLDFSFFGNDRCCFLEAVAIVMF
jgi:hypothetical protein